MSSYFHLPDLAFIQTFPNNQQQVQISSTMSNLQVCIQVFYAVLFVLNELNIFTLISRLIFLVIHFFLLFICKLFLYYSSNQDSTIRSAVSVSILLQIFYNTWQLLIFFNQLSSTYRCKFCSQQFLTRGTRDSHTRKSAPTVTLLFAAGSVTITRNSNSYFTCLCSHAECSQKFDSTAAIHKHIKQSNSVWNGPNEAVCNSFYIYVTITFYITQL